MREQRIDWPGRRRLGSSQRRVCALCLPATDAQVIEIRRKVDSDKGGNK